MINYTTTKILSIDKAIRADRVTDCLIKLIINNSKRKNIMSKLKEINGKYYQECEVVMLATDKKGFALNTNSRGKLHIPFDPNTPQDYIRLKNKPQHLYFLSNEKIKEYCWCIELGFNRVFQAEKESLNQDYIKNCRKIIATTDSSLQIHDKTPIGENINGLWKCLPQPSKEFIQAYIKTYNESKPITKVLVEMYHSLSNDEDEFGNLIPDIYLKVNSLNEITIKKVKNSYTREEVAELCKSAYLDGYSEGGSNVSGYTMSDKCSWFEWLEENL